MREKDIAAMQGLFAVFDLVEPKLSSNTPLYPYFLLFPRGQPPRKGGLTVGGVFTKRL